MRTLSTAALGLAFAIAVAGCVAPAGEGSEPDARTAAVTIQDVWDEIGCKEDDPMGTRGIIDLTPPTPPVVHSGSCTPVDGGDLAFFWELPSSEAASDWLASGDLEIGATDAVFIDGAVVIMATDAATAQEFGSAFQAVD